MKGKRYLVLFLALVSIMTLILSCSQKEQYPLKGPGQYQFGTRMNIEFIDASRGDREISLYIWYPAIVAADAEPSKYNYNAAPDLSGAPYPVVLTSVKEGGYFGSHLASYGFVVVGVLGQDSKPNYGTWLIDYPLDQTSALNFVTKSPPDELEGMFDTDRAGAIGYSFGGYNALAMGGARIDPEHYQDLCANAIPGDPFPEAWWIDYICNIDGGWDTFVTHAGPDITESTDGLWQPFSDERIKAVVSMVPEGAWLFGERGLANFLSPILIIAATEDEINPYDLEASYIYSNLNAPEKSMISFIGQDHMMLFNDEQQDLIKHFCVAFFGFHLKGESVYADYLDEKFISKQEGMAWGIYED